MKAKKVTSRTAKDLKSVKSQVAKKPVVKSPVKGKAK